MENVPKKQCTNCKSFWDTEGPNRGFHKGNDKDGLSYTCKTCSKERTYKARDNNKEHYDEQRRKWQNQDRRKNPQKYNDRKRQWLYGLTPEQYQNLLEEQDNRCAICKEQKQLVVDHCHEQGFVRGLLCHSCNRGLGLLRLDSSTDINSVIKYLQFNCKIPLNQEY